MIRRASVAAVIVGLLALSAWGQISREAPEKIAAKAPKGRLIIAGADATAGEGPTTYQISYVADDSYVGKYVILTVKDTGSVEVQDPRTGKKERKTQIRTTIAQLPFAAKQAGREVVTLPATQASDSTLELTVGRSNTIKLVPRGGIWARPEAGDVVKIAAACPEKSTAVPAKPRKVLVYTKTLGFYHDAIPLGARAIQIMGQKTGAWETVISDDCYMFEPETLAQFDAVMMMSTTGELFGLTGKQANERLRKSLIDFVASGKGLAGSHAATDCSYRWKEYGDMIGGFFAGHPFGQIHVKIDDPKHPVSAAFGGQDFDIRDEIYTFRDPYSRTKQRVLISVDMEKTKLADDPRRPGFKQGENRADHDYALSWVKEYGNGRVFYCAFGHDHGIFWNRMILQHYLDGMQYVLGDLKADATPGK